MESSRFLSHLFEIQEQSQDASISNPGIFAEWLKYVDERYFAKHVKSSIVETKKNGNVQGFFSFYDSHSPILVTIKANDSSADLITARVDILDPKRIIRGNYKDAVASTWIAGQMETARLHGAMCDMLRPLGSNS